MPEIMSLLSEYLNSAIKKKRREEKLEAYFFDRRLIRYTAITIMMITITMAAMA